MKYTTSVAHMYETSCPPDSEIRLALDLGDEVLSNGIFTMFPFLKLFGVRW